MIKKTGLNMVDSKPTSCSNCKYLHTEKEGDCYFRSHLLPGEEYVGCIPAIAHWKEADLVKYKIV
jgi:hypothetical protein